MEANGLGGGLFSSIGPGMVGLELPIQQPQPQQQQQNPQHLNHPHVAVGSYDHPQHRPQSSQPPLKLGGYTNKSKQVAISDDDDNEPGDGKRKMSQWQRMKWTDTMVRLLIVAVFYIGDEVGPEGTAGAEPAKKNNHKPSGAVLQQKKGKWKSVSRAMLDKGFYVSPQQCEDKFNDLNKRYKRVNDILGKGTACRVVEDQSLLESMDLAPRTKEEVRKLLNSKHLFFREMCAYHNSCGHAPAGPHRQSPELTSEPNKQQQQQKQPCLHSTDTTTTNNNNERAVSKGEDEVEEDDKVDDDDDESEDYCDDVDDEPRKRAKKRGASSSLSLIGRFGREVAGVVEDGTKSVWEKKQWLKARMVELEEQQVGYQYESFELEKQRLKWAKFSSKKEREMERAKFENEKKMLENQRMVLLLRHNELELLDHNHNHNQHHSSITA